MNSYLHIRELFEKNKNSAVLYLVNNFRSRNVMKQYFNTIFSDVMAEASADQSAYQNIENISSFEQEELDGLYSYTCYGNDPQKEDGVQIAEIIRMLVGNPAYKVNGRLIRFADFMIITAGKEPIGRLSEIFNELRIPLRVEGKVLFENCPALRVINNLYHCIFDGEDVISLVAVLRGPLYGFTDDELAAYKKSRGRIALNGNIEAAEDSIDQALLKIGQLAKELNRCSPSAFLAVIIREFSLFSYVSNERMEILYYVIELLRDGERSGKIISHREALAYIDELLSDESKLERCLSLNDNTDAVHIANLHKVKGLETPIVILAKAGGNHAPAPNMRIEYEDGEARGYLLALKRKISKIYDETLIATDVYKDKEVSEKLSLGFERDRLDYVAATRARNVLIINNAYSKTGRKSPNRWSKLFKCLKGDVFEILDNGHRYQGSVRDSVRGQDLLKDGELCFDVTPSYVPMTPSTLKAGSRLKQAEAHSAETFSTLIGTMAHRMMEMIIVSKDSIEKEVMIADILAEYLDDDFVDKRLLLTKKLDSLYETIHHGGYRQDSGVERDILPFLLSCDEVYCEVPFTYCLGDELWNGIIDLLYRKDGRLHILDWKTNYDGKDLDDKYQAQLGAYIGAAELLLKEEIVDAHTYHLDLSL